MANIMSTSEKRKKSDLVMVRAAPDQLAELRARAADAGQTVSGYLLAAGLGQKTRSHANAHLVNELRLLGAQQKDLCIVHGGAMTAEYRAVLVEILLAVGRIGV